MLTGHLFHCVIKNYTVDEREKKEKREEATHKRGVFARTVQAKHISEKGKVEIGVDDQFSEVTALPLSKNKKKKVKLVISTPLFLCISLSF